MIYDQVVPPQARRVRARRHRQISAWLVRRGSARLTADGETVTARSGDWLIGLGSEIEQALSPNIHLLSLRIHCAWPSGQALFSGKAVQILTAATYPKLERFALALLKIGTRLQLNDLMENPTERFLWQTQLDFPTYLRYERTLLSWMSALVGAMLQEGREVYVPSRVDPRLAKACGVIDMGNPGQSFPQQEIEQRTELGIESLNRLSSQTYGFTLYRYWEQRRIARARLALEQPSIQVKEVAAGLGFLQLSHFSNWFKRQTGISPREFRNRRK